ncbi:hypothetical protein EYF80_056874 [Liparis tanakae]|uniref:Uncharacterized protein n=1 Tax=Liparis tanakae TaxID=230148 RepID=A0A4Z2EVZ8_9TELE|nr:hypothetical protein EYF80_056874 [Liparis tanakae]
MRRFLGKRAVSRCAGPLAHSSLPMRCCSINKPQTTRSRRKGMRKRRKVDDTCGIKSWSMVQVSEGDPPSSSELSRYGTFLCTGRSLPLKGFRQNEMRVGKEKRKIEKDEQERLTCTSSSSFRSSRRWT